MFETFGFVEQRIIVTGCSSGIGREVARLLVDAGAQVYGMDHAACDLPLASFHRVDLRFQAQIDGALGAIGGAVHGLFYCAGLPPMRPAIDVMKVNFLALRHMCDRLIDHMPSGGSIVGVGSNGGGEWRDRISLIQGLLEADSFETGAQWCEAQGEGMGHAYRFSKEVLAVWTMQNSARTIARGIRLNCTSPGAVETPMLDEIATVAPVAAIDAVVRPIGRRSTPTEQAWPILFLGSALARYINGIDLPVDGGFRAGQWTRPVEWE